MDEPTTYYIEWSESERERLILYSNVNIRNLEKWYWRIYLQGSNGETDIENRLTDVGRGEARVRRMERVTWKLTICKIESPWEFAVWLRKLKQELCIILEGRDGAEMGRRFKRGGYMYTCGWFMSRFESMGFSRQEYWNGLPCLLQGVILTQESNPHIIHWWHWQADSFTAEPRGKPTPHYTYKLIWDAAIDIKKKS